MEGMAPLVEPLEGPELDRVITGLLNLTGIVQLVVDDALRAGPAGEHGLEAIERAARRLRSMLVLFEEHQSDDELARITDFLAITTLMIAEQGGWDDVFHTDAFPEGEMPPLGNP